MSYIIAIPTYKRYETIINKTLKMLKEGGIKNNIINIFVADENEEELYSKYIDNDIKIIIGKKGITSQRNFIVDYYDEGEKIISIDDDIECLYYKNNNKLEIVKDLSSFFNMAFNELIKSGLYIWGIYPVKNIMFMRQNTTYDLRFIVGFFYGFINRKCEGLLCTNINEKEDYMTTLNYYLKDGGVVRLNEYCVKHKKHSCGGLGKMQDRIDENNFACEYLKNKYPQYVALYYRRGFQEIRLKK